MSRKLEVKAGDRYGRLVVVEEAERSAVGNRRFLCRCDCGTEKAVQLSNLRSTEVRSCGCAQKEVAIKTKTSHGESRGKLYNSWNHMKDRSFNKDSKRYNDYGGRGIFICEEWDASYETFRDYVNEVLGPCPEGYSLDRINNDDGYQPGNVRWASPKEQSRNRRNIKLVTAFGETKPLFAWAEEFRMPYRVVYRRITTRNWPPEKALTTPIGGK